MKVRISQDDLKDFVQKNFKYYLIDDGFLISYRDGFIIADIGTGVLINSRLDNFAIF
jgi:hypothetical protein